MTTTRRPWPLRHWVLACTSAEALGMTAAAAAALTATHLQELHQPPTVALLVVIGGGLVEGAALGLLQARVLSRVLGVDGGRWALVTFVVAGVGWAAASAPSAYRAPEATGAEPALWLVVVAAGGLGLAMGAVLGLAQAWVLRGHVTHPWRWTGVSAIAWTPAMAVIFLGATTPASTWPLAAVLAFATLTGALAGAVLGILTGALSPTLDRPGPRAGYHVPGVRRAGSSSTPV